MKRRRSRSKLGKIEDKIKAAIIALGLPALALWLWIKIAEMMQ